MTLNKTKMTNYRWVICALLFFATTINYLDRQVLSLLQPELSKIFHWDDNDYGSITAYFSIAYAISMLLAGRFIDKIGTKAGYAWAIGIWSVGACVHALCGLVTKEWVGAGSTADLIHATGAIVPTIATVSVSMFIISRVVLAIGEAGNFPAAIKATAEYFPKKDRALATGIFNSGSNIGAILAPLTVPILAAFYGWEWAFIIIGVLGFVWLIFWFIFYKKPEDNTFMNQAEIDYINQDAETEKQLFAIKEEAEGKEAKFSFFKLLTYRQTWGLFLAKLLTDGVWWFFLFWTPSYLSKQYGLKGTEMALPLAVLYAITAFGSIFGGKFPHYFMGKNILPYDGRMKAMMFIALVPLLVLFAQPLGYISLWIPVILIGIGGAGHQAWSANFFSTGSDLFPKKAVGSITGITGLAGGVGAFLINKLSGLLFVYSENNWGEHGLSTGYTIVFSYCAVAYLLGWICMKVFTPKFKPIENL